MNNSKWMSRDGLVDLLNASLEADDWKSVRVYEKALKGDKRALAQAKRWLVEMTRA